MTRTSPWLPVAATALAFALVTWLVTDATVLAPMDAWRPLTLRRDTTASEVARAIAVVTYPGVLVGALVVVAWWLWQRRLRRLAWAMAVAPLSAWLVGSIIKRLVGRARPVNDYADLFTSSGAAYPSGHVAVATASAVMLAALATTTRLPLSAQRAWRLAGVLGVLVVALDRWLLGVHWATDLLGGALLGGATASFCLLAFGVRTIPTWELPVRTRPREVADQRRCAVIFNPTKVTDLAMLRRMVTDEVTARGWGEPLWLSTRIDDPGHAMARTAISEGVDLVLCAGGDGTVRVVSSELANTGIPLALVPAGTANLLARNLGIPHDDDAAIALAFTAAPSPVDLVQVVVDSRPQEAEHFVVMGGLGIDGQVMADTSATLKATVKSVAYALAIAQNLNHPAADARVELDGEVLTRTPATLMLLGNVGEIQAGLQLFPSAHADDGELDVLVAGPRGLGAWVRWGLGVLLRRRHRVTTGRGRHVTITVDRPLPYQLDGDTLGTAQRFEATVVPGALLVVRPH